MEGLSDELSGVARDSAEEEDKRGGDERPPREGE